MLLLSSMISHSLQRYVFIPLVPFINPRIHLSSLQSFTGPRCHETRQDCALSRGPRVSGARQGVCLSGHVFEIYGSRPFRPWKTSRSGVASFSRDPTLSDRTDQAFLILYTWSNPLPNLPEINNSRSRTSSIPTFFPVQYQTSPQ